MQLQQEGERGLGIPVRLLLVPGSSAFKVDDSLFGQLFGQFVFVRSFGHPFIVCKFKVKRI